MAEEMIFWMVYFRFARDGRWNPMLGTISVDRKMAIAKYGDTTGSDWNKERRRGLVRCIKVRVVPVIGGEDG